MKKLISFDLDMTLLNHMPHEIPASALHALEKLRERDHLIVLATGRDMDNRYSFQYRDLIRPDAIIHMNGTKITVGNELLYDACMEPELLEKILKFAQEQGYCVGVTIGDEDYYVNPDILTDHDKKRWQECGRQYRDPWKLMETGVRTLAYIGTPEGAREFEKAFPQLKLPLFAGLEGADIIEKKNSKALGLERLCEHWGIPMEDTIAFGDSMNDYEIIQAAGIGVAMGNAVEKLQQAADYVTDPIMEDGIWNACQRLGLI